MQLTTNFELAKKGSGNRAAAMDELMRNHAIGSDTDPDQIEEWIDDVIAEWCEELKQEIAEGRFE